MQLYSVTLKTNWKLFIFQGDYYPAVSTYKHSKVRLNFGPKFRFPPKNVEFKAMSKRAEEMAVEQTLADMKFFTESEGKLSLDKYVMEQWKKFVAIDCCTNALL